MKVFPSIFFAMAALLTLAACNSRPQGGKLEGTSWILASIKIGNKGVPLPSTTKVSLVFSEGGLNGNAPCNSYFAAYSTAGTVLSVDDLGTTKRACDEMDFESAYLGLLSKATGYSARKDELEVFCQGGLLIFESMSDDEAERSRRSQAVGKLTAQFPPIDAGDALHLYPIIRVDNPGDYPYEGTLLDTASYQYFDEDVREVWSGSGGDVLAVGQYGGYYICRVPGRYVSSDIALFRLAGTELRRVETIAWAWCDEGWCNQQDAWLTDVDGDGLTDAVQHYTLTDDRGRIQEERMTLLLQSKSGDLDPDTNVRLNPKQYIMARI